MPLLQCPVHGCGAWSSSWGRRRNGYLLSCFDAFTLLLDPTVDITENSRICEKCYNTHRRPNSDADGR